MPSNAPRCSGNGALSFRGEASRGGRLPSGFPGRFSPTDRAELGDSPLPMRAREINLSSTQRRRCPRRGLLFELTIFVKHMVLIARMGARVLSNSPCVVMELRVAVLSYVS